jgi:DNA polymerase III delta prime subunit
MIDIKNIEGNVVTSSMHDKIWLFYGPPGTWKTTVATGNQDRTLLIAYEIGYKFIPGVRAVKATNWHAIKDVIRQLQDDEVKAMYDTVVIDTIGLAYKACMAYVCAKKGVTEIGEIPYGQGYSMAKNEFEKTISTIPQLGYGLILIAHSDELNDEKNGISVRVDIDKRPSSVIKGMADFILYTRKEKLDNTESDEQGVYAYSESSNPNIEVKSRARFFPKRVLFTYENILKSLDEAIQKQNDFFGADSVDAPNFEIYKENEVDLPSLQNEIISLARELMSTPLSDKVGKILETELKGIPVSKTNKSHASSLYSVRDELIELKKSI